jgi:hypothetical protein
MLLREEPRQYLLDLGYGDKAAQRLRVSILFNRLLTVS